MFIVRLNGHKHSAFNTKETAWAAVKGIPGGLIEVEYDSSVQVMHGFNFKGGK